MRFTDKLLSGTLIKRYKRFFVDVKVNNKIITAHCPNSGSMLGLLEKGNQIWISKSLNPKRKLKYTLELIKVNNSLVGINTHLANKIVYEALKNKSFQELNKFENIKAEAVYDKETRFDFFLSNEKKRAFLEVKNVTLVRKANLAEFPDAITSRGTKHLKELIAAKKKGYESCILYLIQREDCKYIKIANDIDKNYKKTFDDAIKSGVKILCYDCKLNNEEIIINNQINYDK